MSGPPIERPPSILAEDGPEAREWFSTVAIVAALIGLYFIVPFGQRDDPLPLGVATALAIITVLGLALMIWRRIIRILSGVARPGLPGLLIFLAAVTVAFSMAYFLLSRSDPGQIEGLETRLDALYFTLTTLATIGYGDIHPAGQAARAVACIQFIFNAIFLGGLLRATIYQAKVVRAAKQPPP
jgi:voltage-gated potassium channel